MHNASQLLLAIFKFICITSKIDQLFKIYILVNDIYYKY